MQQRCMCICHRIRYIGVVCGIDVDVVSQYNYGYYCMCIYIPVDYCDSAGG
jgi:hypothetical protein